MAYAMTKRGSLDNEVTYEFICDQLVDMNAIEKRYRTIGSIAIVLQGESGGLEVYIAGSDKQWNSLSAIGGSSEGTTGGLSIYICGQNEVNNGLPDISEPDETTVYLVPAGNTSGNLFEEYIYVDGAWEKFGAASIDLSNYIQKTDIATQSTAGLVKVLDNGNVTFNENNQLVLTLAGTAVVKTGQSDHPISVTHQHEAAFYGLAKAAGQDMKNSDNTIGTYTTEAASAIRTMIGAGTYSKPSGGIPVADLASGVIPDTSIYAPKASPVFTGSISLDRKANTTIGSKSFAIGTNVEASGNYSHAEGGNTTASESYTHAEGYSTTASGYCSHAEGNFTTASSYESHAEGYKTSAFGYAAHAEGYGGSSLTYNNTTYIGGTASGYAAHNEGYDSYAGTTAAHAEGYQTQARGYYSHTEGQGTISTHRSQHVGGEFNVIDSSNHYDSEKGTYAEIIGNGTTNAYRCNARALDWSGNEYLNGNLYVGCNNDSTGGSKVATESYVNSAIVTYESRISALETEIASLRTALLALSIETEVTLENGQPLTDEQGNLIEYDTPTT